MTNEESFTLKKIHEMGLELSPIGLFDYLCKERLDLYAKVRDLREEVYAAEKARIVAEKDQALAEERLAKEKAIAKILSSLTGREEPESYLNKLDNLKEEENE